MVYEILRQMIQSITPADVYLPQAEVEKTLAEKNWFLVPVYRRDQLVISTSAEADGLVPVIDFQPWDIDEYFSNKHWPVGQSLYRNGDRLFIVKIAEAPSGWQRISMADAANVMSDLGYNLYWTKVQESGEYAPYKKIGNVVLPHIHLNDNDNWWGHLVFTANNSLLVSWHWNSDSVDGNIVTFTPEIRGNGNTRLNAEVESILINLAGLKSVQKTLEEPVVTMPEPDWLSVGEWNLYCDQLPLSEARKRAQAFVQRLREAGLLEE